MFHRISLLVVAILAVLSTVNAFSPRMGARAQSRSLAMKSENAFASKLAVPAALIPFLAPMAAFAAEGTGRAFGIDDGRLVWAALAPSFIIFPLFIGWAKQQDGDDFFDGYEKRRNG